MKPIVLKNTTARRISLSSASVIQPGGEFIIATQSGLQHLDSYLKAGLEPIGGDVWVEVHNVSGCDQVPLPGDLGRIDPGEVFVTRNPSYVSLLARSIPANSGTFSIWVTQEERQP